MEQLVILIIIGLISLINWIMQKSAEAREKARARKVAERGDSPFESETPTEAASQRSEPNPEEGMRKLMEALGLPMEEAPRPVPKAAAPPPLPVEESFFQSHTPAPAFVEQRPKPVVAPSIIQQPTVRRRRERRAFPAEEVKVESQSRQSLQAILSSRGALRNAVLMSEVLGKPRALRKSEPFAN